MLNRNIETKENQRSDRNEEPHLSGPTKNTSRCNYRKPLERDRKENAELVEARMVISLQLKEHPSSSPRTTSVSWNNDAWYDMVTSNAASDIMIVLMRVTGWKSPVDSSGLLENIPEGQAHQIL